MTAMAQVPSVWAATAREEASHAALQHAVDADVAVVGGGIHRPAVALAAAAARRGVAVPEAATAGLGASGRHGGLVVPTCRRRPG